MTMPNSIMSDRKYFIRNCSLILFVDEVFRIDGCLANVNYGCDILRSFSDDSYFHLLRKNYFGNLLHFDIIPPDEIKGATWFVNGTELAYLKADLKLLMAERLKKRLGAVYCEFEKRMRSETLIMGGGTITVKDLRHLRTLAHNLAYVADISTAIDSFIMRRTDILSSEATNCKVSAPVLASSVSAVVQTCDAENGLCETCAEQEFKAAFGADIKAILNTCPKEYSEGIIVKLERAAPEIKTMIHRFKTMNDTSANNAENQSDQTSLRKNSSSFTPAFASISDADFNDYIASDGVYNDAQQPSLLYRLFCCFFSEDENVDLNEGLIN